MTTATAESTKLAAAAVPQQAVTKEVEVSKHYRPPAVRVGDQVYWYRDGDARNEPIIGVVIQLQSPCVMIAACFPGQGWKIKDIVRHISDPQLKNQHFIRHQHGAWDFSPQQVVRNNNEAPTLAEFDALKESHGALQKQLSEMALEFVTMQSAVVDLQQQLGIKSKEESSEGSDD